MPHRRSLSKKLLTPLALLGVVVVSSITLVGAFLIRSNLMDSMMEQYEATHNVFVDSISQDLVQGIESEVNRKCKALFSNPAVLSVYISRVGSDRPICDLTKNSSAPSQKISKSIEFGDLEHSQAGQVIISYKKQPISPSLFWQYSFALIVIGLIVLAIYWFFTKDVIQRGLEPLKTLSELLESKHLTEIQKISDRLKPDASIEVENLYLGVEEQAKKLFSYEEKLVEKTKLDTRSEIASLVAHDIRSPLSGIAAVQADPSIGRENQNLIKESLEKINYLVDQISLKDKNESDNEIFDIGLSVKNILKLKSIEHESNHINFSFRLLRENSIFVFGQRQEFERALSNILNNAFQAIPENQNGNIALSFDSSTKDLKIEISDSGEGIPNELLSRIGRKGFSLKSNGSGLGVYQANKAITQMGGKLKFESKRGVGTTVKVTIPIAYKKEKIIFNSQENDRFLIVDDDPLVLDSWRQILGDLPKEKVKSFSKPSQTEKWAKKAPESDLRRYLSFVDFDMGVDEKNGVELLSELKSRLKSTYLVTGRWMDPSVYVAAKNLGISIWPKDWLGYIEVHPSTSQAASTVG